MTKFCSVIMACLLMAACSNDTANNKAGSTTNNNPSTETNSNPPTEAAAAPGTAKHVKASAIAPLVGLWAYTLAITDDLARKKDYEGRWIQFESDQTFTNGKWGKEMNAGTFEYDFLTKILKLYYKNQKDGTFDWKLKIDNDVMIWLGNADINQTGDQIRMARATERPQDIQ